MLSYRHQFHAGNHADVIKHIVLVQCLQYLVQKDTPLLYIDTHAGAAFTSLFKNTGGQNAEYQQGIALLFNQTFTPVAIDDYVACVKKLQPSNASGLRTYPGSPAFANAILRPQDRLKLAELHPQDYAALLQWSKRQANNRNAKHIFVSKSDGFLLPRQFLPPPRHRALLLIDPPYEVKSDYANVVTAVKEALHRLQSATIIVWLPLIARRDAIQTAEKLRTLNPHHLFCRLQLSGTRMYHLSGSLVVVINPPYILENVLKPAMPILVDRLSEGNAEAHFSLEQVGG